MADVVRQKLEKEVETDTAKSTKTKPVSGQARQSAFAQLELLLKRELFLTLADKPNMSLLLLQAPAIALILGLLFSQDVFSLSQTLNAQGSYAVIDAPTLLFMLVVSSVFFGAINSCRELVKERSIYRREKLLGVRPSVYLLSKLLTLAAKGVLSVGILLAVVTMLIPFPWSTAEYGQAFLLCWGTYLGGVGLGLSLSAVVKNSEQASTLVPVILILQLVLSGAFVSPDQMTGPISSLSIFAVCRWSFAGLCHISEVNQRFHEIGLPYLASDYFLPIQQLWSVFGPLLALHLVLPLLLLYLRKDNA